MNDILIGVSAHRDLTQQAIESADYLEIKKISTEEVLHFKEKGNKPLFFHIQYTEEGHYYLPTIMDFHSSLPQLRAAFESGTPAMMSLHFGLSARSITIDEQNYVAVAAGEPLEKSEITQNLEKNLRFLKSSFPHTKLLVENVEFIPEALSFGAYRYIQEAGFFTCHVSKWLEKGIIDGILFDVAHGLIAAGNHPFYNGLGTDPLDTDEEYISRLKHKNALLDYFENYISMLPLSVIEEIHISGIARYPNGVWVDAHKEVGQKELDALALLLEKLPGVRRNPIPITLEYIRKPGLIPRQIEHIRAVYAGMRY